MVFLYTISEIQVAICICTSILFLMYLVVFTPYKASILNRFSIFNELCVFICSCSLLAFSSIEFESNQTTQTTTTQDYCGWIIIVSSSCCLICNCVFLFPVKLYETFVLVKKIASKINSFIFKKAKNKIAPKTKQLYFTEGKILFTNENNSKSLHPDEIRKCENTRDNTANMSALVLNSPTKNNMRIFENGNELNPNTDSKKYNFAEDLDCINVPITQRYHITKIKDSVRQQVLKADFKEALTVRDARNEGLMSSFNSRNNIKLANLDSIILNTARSYDEENDHQHNFKRKKETLFQNNELSIDVIQVIKRNNYLLSPRNNIFEDNKLEQSNDYNMQLSHRSKNRRNYKF